MEENFPELKVYCVGHRGDADWIPDIQMVQMMKEADIVVFPGGSDWEPRLYNETQHNSVHVAPHADEYQLRCLIQAISMNKFLVGICRGAQLFGIAAGGSLFQDVGNHAGRSHAMVSNTMSLMTNSLHHQMVHWTSIPEVEKRGKLILWADSLSNRYINQYGFEWRAKGVELRGLEYKEPEFFYFPSFSALGIQGHPEMGFEPQSRSFILRYLKILYKRHVQDKNLDYIKDVYLDQRLAHFANIYPGLKAAYNDYKEMEKIKVLFSTSEKPILPQQINIPLKEDTKPNKDETKKDRIRSVQATGKW